MSNRNTDEFDNAQRALFREVTEDVEKEQFLLFWKKYGKRFAIISSVCLLAAFSFVGYTFYCDWKVEQNAIIYADALSKSLHNPTSAGKKFDQLIQEDSDGFALLSKIQKAALLLDEGKKEEGFDVLRSIANTDSVPMPFRNLSGTILAYHLLDEKDKQDEIIALATPLAMEGSLWRGSAKEILALVALQQNDTEKAIELLQQNVTDTRLPDSFKVRAQEMLSAIK